MDKKKILSEWVHSYSDYLLSWALRKVNQRANAEDLVQDTFLAAFKNLDTFEQKSSPKTWLLAILNRKIIDYYRKSSQKAVSLEGLEQQSAASFTDSLFNEKGHWNKHHFDSTWEQESNLLDNPVFVQTLNSCLERIPQNWQSALFSKYTLEKEAKEICKELDISMANYWQILHRAKLALKKCIDGKWQ